MKKIISVLLVSIMLLSTVSLIAGAYGIKSNYDSVNKTLTLSGKNTYGGNTDIVCYYNIDPQDRDTEEITIRFSEDAYFEPWLSNPEEDVTFRYHFSMLKVKTFEVDENNEHYSTDENGILYNKDKTVLYYYPQGLKAESFVVPETVEKIADGALGENEYLKKLVISDNVSNIESISDLKNLEYLYLGKNISFSTEIFCTDCDIVNGEELESCKPENSFISYNTPTIGFIGLPSLKTIEVSEENNSLKVNDNVLFSKDGKNLLLYPSKSERISYTVPYGTEAIGKFSFESSSVLENIYLPETLTRIELNAFYMSTALKNIQLPSSIEYIGAMAFMFVPVTDFIIPDGVEKLKFGTNAFYFCKLETLVIPKGAEISNLPNECIATLKNIINNSDTTVFTRDVENSFYYDDNIAIDINIFLTQNLIFYDENECLKKVNDKFNTSFVSIDEIGEYTEQAIHKGINPKLSISCLENSAQHDYCIENNIPHDIIGSACDDACGIHDIYNNEYIAPTCTENGYRGGKVCLECEKVFEEPEIIAPTGHTVVTVAEIPATCTVGGVTAYSYCSVCEEYITKPENIIPTGHVDHNEDGLCDNCGEQITDEEITFTFFERVRNFFATIIDRIIAIFRRLFK